MSDRQRSEWIRSALNLVLGHFVFLALGLAGPGCTSKDKQEPSTQGNVKTVSLAQRGKTVYQTQCIACHNSDPKKPGGVGPEVFGSSKELLEARILRLEYPPHYTPKRTTQMMTPMPHLKNDIDALHAYLNSDNP